MMQLLTDETNIQVQYVFRKYGTCAPSPQSSVTRVLLVTPFPPPPPTWLGINVELIERFYCEEAGLRASSSTSCCSQCSVCLEVEAE